MEGRGWRGEDGGERMEGRGWREEESGRKGGKMRGRLRRGRRRREGTVGGVVCLPAVACLLFSNSS